jgi:hypothetical protein
VLAEAGILARHGTVEKGNLLVALLSKERGKLRQDSERRKFGPLALDCL